MARKKGISRAKLNTLVKGLPQPVKDHLRRCKKFADYFLRRVCDEEWFIDGNYKSEFILSAISLHDVGKVEIPKDCFYFSECNTNAKREKYWSHVREGVSVCERENGISFDEFRENSYEKTLLRIIDEHHERFDGSGLHGKSGREISFEGRLTAVIDAFDHYLFVGVTTGIDFDGAVEKVKEGRGTLFDGDVVDQFFADEASLRDFVEYVSFREKDNRRKDRYGVQLRYAPVYNLLGGVLDRFVVDIVINDPYYGVLASNLFVPVAEKAGSIFQLEKIGFEKLCINIEKIMLRGLQVPEFAYRFSARHMEKKNFFKDVKRIMKRYEVNPSKIVFVMTETSLVDYGVNVENAVNGCHEIGVRLFIGEFGEQLALVSACENTQVDGVIFKQEYGPKMAVNPKSYNIIAGLVRIIEKLPADIVLAGIDEARAEERAIKMGAKYAYGKRYGRTLVDKEVVEYVKRGGASNE